MSTEMMKCCGALTKVYADAGNRQHNPGCRWVALNERAMVRLEGVDTPTDVDMPSTQE